MSVNCKHFYPSDLTCVLVLKRTGSLKRLFRVPTSYVLVEKSEKLEDLKVLRRSPDLLNDVKKVEGQLHLIM